MKDAAVQKQLDRLAELEAKAEATKSASRDLRSYTRTLAYRDALSGKHAFFDPTTSRDAYEQRVGFYDSEFSQRLDEMLAEADSLPAISRQRWDKRRNVRIGIIADRFLYESLRVAADFVPLTPENLDDEIPTLDLLLVVSAWRGLEDEWHGFGGANSAGRRLFSEKAAPLARSLDIPIVFYSKEDPPNFAKFLGLAKEADFIFTSAEEMVPKYQEAVGDGTPVEALRFAVNFERTNPVGSERFDGNDVVFAGSWLAHKYKSRAQAAKKIFKGVQDSHLDLSIFDRNADLDQSEFKSDLSRYNYPDDFLPHLRRPISHEDVHRIQRLLPFGVNLNSVTASSTMFANRVVELLATGTTVLSNYSNGVNSLYPYVAIVDSEIDAQQFVDNLSTEYFRYGRASGIRDVFLNDTAFERVDQILDVVGVPHTRTEHRILVVADDEQTFADFVASQDGDFDFRWVTGDEVAKTQGSEGGDVVVFADNLSLNSPFLVADAVAAFRYSDVDAVELCSVDDPRACYEFVEPGPRSSLQVVWLEPGETFNTTPIERAILVRTAAVANTVVSSPEAKDLTVIVPVYNNGRFLIHKCFQSLRRSSVFSTAEILLVDDGSTDKETLHALAVLEQVYENVSVFRFPPGGSGSASRPRNKGLELARTKFVTYLDPDNEQVEDAYIQLLELMRSEPLSFALGNMVKFKGTRSVINNSWHLKKSLKSAGVNRSGQGTYHLGGNNRELLATAQYQPMSIQALIADTAWLRSTGIEQPEGAVGQDSYFFQQMLYYAENIAVVPTPVHVYYAEVANSTVNSISAKFYRKYLPLEEARSSWLKEIGLIDHYSDTRFMSFLEKWYLVKLKDVVGEDRAESISRIHEIASMYGPRVTESPQFQSLMAEAKEESSL